MAKDQQVSIIERMFTYKKKALTRLEVRAVGVFNWDSESECNKSMFCFTKALGKLHLHKFFP